MTARDGMLAYELPNWTREKLHYIGSYLDIFCTAMRDKRTLVYADMLAGPGICVDPHTNEEKQGSALLAANHAEFDRLFINDLNPLITNVLRHRFGQQPQGRVQISTGDCNDGSVIDEARSFLFPPGTVQETLGVAVIDPQAYEMRFDSIQKLTDGLRLDLIMIFMTSYAKRFLEHPTFEERLGRMIGPDAVTKMIERRRCGYRLTFGDLLDAFEMQLNRIDYPYVYTPTRTENSRGATLYHIVFASRHERGKEFFQKISHRRWTGQKRMVL